MEELSQIIKQLHIGINPEDALEFEYVNIFKNPNNLPINQIHLELSHLELKCDFQDSVLPKDVAKSCFERKKQIAPALSKCWLPENNPLTQYQPYNFTLNKEENCLFLEANKLFLQSLQFLLSVNYHQFWCLVMFETNVPLSLHRFLLNPVPLHQTKYLPEEECGLYLAVFTQFQRVYQRLITFEESQTEYMPPELGFNYLLEKKLINLPIILTLALLYHQTNLDFTNRLTALYFGNISTFRVKEVEEMLNQVNLTLEMIGGHVCGFAADSIIVPIAIDKKPQIFNPNWVYQVVEYLRNTIQTLYILLTSHKASISTAITNGIANRLSYTYEKVFFELYDYISDRPERKKNPDLFRMIYEEIALARSEFVDVFNVFVSFSLDKTLEFSGDSKQQDYLEMYLNLMTSALEDEYFISDYHERYDVGIQNEMFTSCSDIDPTRTDYILNCITCLRRHNRISKTLKADIKVLNKAITKYANRTNIKQPDQVVETVITNNVEALPTEKDIEESISVIIDTFPHLGDGFVLQCLEAYNYNSSDVINAILEENLPPYLVDIPFDMIRIPNEPTEPSPILAYTGKKNECDDALKILNDKKDFKEIKTFILDGIEYTNKYDLYDDDFDERYEAPIPVADQGSDDILKFNPNHAEDVVSDTSYSEDEQYDEATTTATKSKNFCEDPAKIRERAEERRRSRLGSKPKVPNSNNNIKSDVVGKQKGQGQEKNVLANRHKKSVNKSSRANHNRKGGAQWKRNRGMLPS